MKYFSHFFIGKEFAKTISHIGKQTLKYRGNDDVSSINLFLVDGAKVSKLECSSSTKDEALTGFDKNLEVEWGEETELVVSDVKTISDFYAKKIYDRILTINNSGNNSVLHVVLHFPLYKPEALETVKQFYNAIENANRPTEIDFMGYCDDIADVIEPDFKITTSSSKQIEVFAKFRDKKKMAFNRHFIAIQNASQNGISLGLNCESLGNIIGIFSILCVDHYDEIFPNILEYKDVVSFGLSTLCLDKYLFVEYLMSKTILHSMDSAEVNSNEVDVNFACNTASHLLKDKTSLLSELFKQIDTTSKEEKEGFEQFEQEITQVIEKCREIFQTNKSITIRAAILAAILSKTECELFSKTIFNHDAANIDNLFNEPVNYFIDNDKIGFYKIDDKTVVNPIRELKEINNKLINSKTEIRDLQEQLSSLEKQISDAQTVESCFIEDGFFHFHDKKFRLLPYYKEEPLEEIYLAANVNVKSANLNEKFNAVKNQGAQGSCLAHALTSIFEYILKLNQAKEFDLSEAFLYYNARNLDTYGDISVDTDTGSRFKPAMDSLLQFGIALEKLCPYNENVYNQKPNDAAYQDAESRKLLRAMSVNSCIDDIKSALAEGFPVAISLSLFPSFNPVNGFIPMPSQQEIDDLKSGAAENLNHSCHAMVITGFNDDIKMFAVRNSWGESWGEQGYCYIPYAYIGNSELCNFRCIITELESQEVERYKMKHIPALKIDDTDLNIRYIITEDVLQKELQEADNLRRQSDSLQIYFEQIKKLFLAPNQRDAFIDKAKEQLTEEQEGIRKTIKTKKEKQDAELKKYNLYKKQTQIKSASFVFGTIFFKILLIGWGWTISYWWLISVFGIYGGIIFYKSNKRWREWRDKRDELDEEIRKLNREIATKEKEKNNFKIKTFSAWSLLKALEKLQAHFQFLYGNTVSLINNLRAWYKEAAEAKEDIKLETTAPNTSLLNAEILDTFFNNKLKNDATFEIDFCEGIENHKIEKDYLKGYKDALFDRIAKNLLAIKELNDFDISVHTADNRFSEIAKPITRNLIDDIDNKSWLFLNISSNERGIIIPSTGIYASSLNQYKDVLRKKLGKYSEPYFESNNKYRLVFLKTATLWFRECINLKNQKNETFNRKAV